MAALDAAQQHFNYQLLRRVMKALRQHVAWIVRLALEDKVRKEALRKIEMEMEEARRKVEEARRKKEEEDAKREAEVSTNSSGSCGDGDGNAVLCHVVSLASRYDTSAG